MGSEIWNPFKVKLMLILLYGMISIAYVGIVERDCAAKGFKVVSSSARRTVIYPKSGVVFNQGIPEAVKRLNMQVF